MVRRKERSMESGDPVAVVDVRTAEEYAEAHIPGAILLPNEDIGDTAPEQLPVLDAEILIYCRSGNRSAQAAKKLVALGYTNVSDFGGMLLLLVRSGTVLAGISLENTRCSNGNARGGYALRPLRRIGRRAVALTAAIIRKIQKRYNPFSDNSQKND